MNLAYFEYFLDVFLMTPTLTEVVKANKKLLTEGLPTFHKKLLTEGVLVIKRLLTF